MMNLGVGGRPLKRSSRTTSRAVANKQLEHWKAQIRQGTYVPDADQTRFEDLVSLLLDEYRANERKSLDRVKAAVDHLKEFFTGWRAQAVSTDRILAYVRHRQVQQAANATINRELAALKRMYRLAEETLSGYRPTIRMLEEDNVRRGFFERPQFEALLTQLPDDLQPAITTAYITGWRIKSELFTRLRHHVDLGAGWLRLEPGETKNRKGRMFPLTPELHAVLERRATILQRGLQGVHDDPKAATGPQRHSCTVAQSGEEGRRYGMDQQRFARTHGESARRAGHAGGEAAGARP
jgi:hypothetical protein